MNTLLKYANSALIPSFLILFVLVFSSCDKIDDPFEKKDVQPTDTSGQVTGYTRYILVEEFTGHTCTNCPDGAREILRLDSLYGAKLIPVSIHAGAFSSPHNPPDTSYLTDFRTPEGNTYNSTFIVFLYPSAMISRKDDGSGGGLVMGKGSWENAISNLADDTASVAITTTNTYLDAQRQLTSKIKVKWLSDDTGTYKLQVYLIEDHITDWQLDGGFNNPNYDHRHVFRKSLNGTWGTDIPSSAANDTASFEYTLQLNSNWNADNCEVVSFIYHSSTYEVIQANESHVK